MKKLALFLFGLTMAVPAYGWNCSTSGQVRVQVPAGTVGNGTGDGSGQVVVDNGLTFICEALPTATTGSPITNSNTNSNASNSTSTATGGNANATGGNVNNSGNSSNANTLSNKQGQKQSQSQSNISTNNNQSAGGSVSNVGNSQTLVEAPQIPVNTAVAPPVFSTANCFKGFSAGGQTAVGGLSFGGGGIDKNCSALITAQDYFAMGNRLAACKVITNTKASKDAGVTMADCMNAPVRPVPVVVPSIPVAVPVINPAPIQVTVNVPPTPAPIIIREEVTVQATKAQVKAATKHKAVHRPCPVTEIQNQCAVKTQEK